MHRDRTLPWSVFGVFVVLTLLATWYVWESTRAADRARFENAVQSTRDALGARIDTYLNVLTAVRGLAVADPTRPRGELIAYIRSLNVQRRYPGVQGIGVSIRIFPDDVDDLENEMRSEGFEEFRITPATPRPEYHAIVVLEPLDRRNRAAMGYDMFTEPRRRDAMMRARDSGRPAASAPVTLVQEIDAAKQPGFLIYTPLYVTGTTPQTLDERRRALIGFVYAPFRAHDFLTGIFGTQRRPEIGFEIRDNNRLLYRTPDLPAHPRFAQDGTIDVAGRRWEVRWISRRQGRGASAMLAFGTFVGGMIIATLLMLLVRTQLRARAEAERTTERLLESEAALQKANRAKDEFLATLSHELRTPMTAILGWSQMLEEEDLAPEVQRDGLDSIRRSAKTQAQLIEDLLDVSRITSGKMRIDPRPVELAPVVASAINTVRTAADVKGVRIIPDIAGDVWVKGDGQRLQQVVWNLLSNAVKFTGRDGEVRVELRAAERDAIIEVCDTGQGIDPAFMPFVFERFRQADGSSTRQHMGLGLGLAIVRHLLELHGGTIAAESRGIGHGATFRAVLPLLRERTPIAAPQSPATRHDRLQNLRVLVVDDDDEVRKYVSSVLMRSGVEVRCESSARAALDALELFPADVVLTDLGMPDADGFDLLHWIRNTTLERTRNVPVVALTAFAMPEDRQRVEEGGFQGYITKPVEPEMLRAGVVRALIRVDESEMK
ncbi:MAG TPA: CHASE domain-containing protein [Thermoanaerobaculia bacterium]|nr:CHASE domain-containing protein [Thermoanaerobaculia bacterium]